jgi:cytochrome c oxidase subunit 2
MTTAILRLPVNRSVQLAFTAKDVIHSFWVPEFGQKQDTVPGLHTTLHITPNKTGTFPVICTELCGLGHAVMRTTVVVMSQARFDRWLKGQAAVANGAGGGATGGGGTTTGSGNGNTNASALGATVFKNNGCNSCHTFKPANATGKVGPDLDQLPEEAKRAGQELSAFVRESIVNPSAYVEKGFPNNVMPHTYGSLPKQQLDALVQYLTANKG